MKKIFLIFMLFAFVLGTNNANSQDLVDNTIDGPIITTKNNSYSLLNTKKEWFSDSKEGKKIFNILYQKVMEISNYTQIVFGGYYDGEKYIALSTSGKGSSLYVFTKNFSLIYEKKLSQEEYEKIIIK